MFGFDSDKDNHVEHPVFAAIMGAVLDEVVRPDVIGVRGPQAHTRPVRQQFNVQASFARPTASSKVPPPYLD
jgi:hypothetical protein